MEDLSVFVGRQEIGWFAFAAWQADVHIESYIKPDNLTGCNIVLHTDFVFLVTKGDIPIDNNHVRPIELTHSHLGEYHSKTARLVGWGRVNKHEWRAKELRWADVSIQSDEQCRFRLDGDDYVPGSTLCAFSDHGGCRGDSGGPVQFWEGNKWVLIGILSSAVLDFHQDGDLCGPDRVMLIKGIPAKWRNLVRKLTSQLTYELAPSRDEFRQRVGYGGWSLHN